MFRLRGDYPVRTTLIYPCCDITRAVGVQSGTRTLDSIPTAIWFPNASLPKYPSRAFLIEYAFAATTVV